MVRLGGCHRPVANILKSADVREHPGAARAAKSGGANKRGPDPAPPSVKHPGVSQLLRRLIAPLARLLRPREQLGVGWIADFFEGERMRGRNPCGR